MLLSQRTRRTFAHWTVVLRTAYPSYTLPQYVTSVSIQGRAGNVEVATHLSASIQTVGMHCCLTILYLPEFSYSGLSEVSSSLCPATHLHCHTCSVASSGHSFFLLLGRERRYPQNGLRQAK